MRVPKSLRVFKKRLHITQNERNENTLKENSWLMWSSWGRFRNLFLDHSFLLEKRENGMKRYGGKREEGGEMEGVCGGGKWKREGDDNM